MARNDTVLLDGIIEDRIEKNLPSNDKGEVFEYLVLEQVLKEYDLSFDEIGSGWVDGGHDGGIDGFYILINGHLLQDINDFVWPKKGADLSVYIITCKHHETYKQAVLESLISTVNEFLDFRVKNSELNGEYNEDVLRKRDEMIFAYKKSSPRLNSFKINYCYASRGESKDVGQSIISRANQIVKITEESFGQCIVKFEFLGAREIVSLFRQVPNFSLELPYLDSLSRGERYILIVRLKDYYDFLKNESDDTLRRYLFESNVRDFMGLNAVNEDIKLTLSNKNSPDFWLLNNGVTILSTSAQLIGQSIYMEDIQIVNGLQTSESIFRHFSNSGEDVNDRAVMIKVIVSQDEMVRDQIIRATNNQTAVEQSSLHATERIQRDIEDILLRNGFYYDRRKNFYKNQGVPRDLIITPLYLASGAVNLLLKMPHHAGRMRAKVLRSNVAYEAIFSEKIDLNIWPKISSILKKADDFLIFTRGSKSGEGFLKKWRYILSFCAVSLSLKKFDFTAKDILRLNIDEFSSVHIPLAWAEIVKVNSNLVAINSHKLNKENVKQILEVFNSEFGVKNINCVEKYNNVYDSITGMSRPYRNINVSEEFINSVEVLLPPQPWKVGMNRTVIETLGCSMAQYTVAIESLVKSGRIYRQKDGVLYNLEGEVVGVDSERLNSD
ncbi:AIPR family protein [Rahnella victoriana]|nr:AIPR family protein [Rahnella victoriana]